MSNFLGGGGIGIDQINAMNLGKMGSLNIDQHNLVTGALNLETSSSLILPGQNQGQSDPRKQIIEQLKKKDDQKEKDKFDAQFGAQLNKLKERMQGSASTQKLDSQKSTGTDDKDKDSVGSAEKKKDSSQTDESPKENLQD